MHQFKAIAEASYSLHVYKTLNRRNVTFMFFSSTEVVVTFVVFCFRRLPCMVMACVIIFEDEGDKRLMPSSTGRIVENQA